MDGSAGCSVGYQLISRKSYPIFLAVKIPYRTHSSLDTTSRICRIVDVTQLPITTDSN